MHLPSLTRVAGGAFATGLENGGCGLEPHFRPLNSSLAAQEPQPKRVHLVDGGFPRAGLHAAVVPSRREGGLGARGLGGAVSGGPAPAGCLPRRADPGGCLVGAPAAGSRERWGSSPAPEAETGCPPPTPAARRARRGGPGPAPSPRSCRLAPLSDLHPPVAARGAEGWSLSVLPCEMWWRSPRGWWEGGSVSPEWPCPRAWTSSVPWGRRTSAAGGGGPRARSPLVALVCASVKWNHLWAQ